MDQNTTKLKTSFATRLWGENAKTKWLWITMLLLLFGMLGSRTPWTMERRWVSIVGHMLATGDYLHPFLNGKDYYDKPLMTYWLIVVFTKLFHAFNTWTLRLPSAIAGCVTLWGTYRLGFHFGSRTLALKSAWLLLTAFGFAFWARVAGADIYNMMGIVLALLWYIKHREQTTFASYFIFFLIIIFTSLCKGLGAPACTLLAILPDFIYQKGWKKHLAWRMWLALIINLGLYVLPFWLSSHFNSGNYQESGLVEVFRENVLRFFAPFDHVGPWYTYFIYLPYYFFPWVLFMVPACILAFKNWKTADWETRWLVWIVGLLFLFFSLSQSRRSYYILPLLPFAALMTASWIQSPKNNRIMGGVVVFMVVTLLIYYWIGLPVYYHGVNVPLN